jgi:hypothetical protein
MNYARHRNTVNRSNELLKDVLEIVVNGMSHTKCVRAACRERLDDTKCTLVIIKLHVIELRINQIRTYASARSVSIDELQIEVLAILTGRRLLERDPMITKTHVITYGGTEFIVHIESLETVTMKKEAQRT